MSSNQNPDPPSCTQTASVCHGPGALNRFVLDASNQRQDTGRVRNSCHRCGATAYKKLMARSDDGVMRPSGLYQCVQCRQVFSHIHEWRDGLRQ